eukprot:TRINITY_DN4146_c0_g1_i1.p1 TRINITY_DN4146_c0_g1~~TRINITY_DN4146_c0_g1_i1.p1  ORF type:complete len:395 (-),score=96.94 TRINITY_DN4146_c0_g1_i1:8-1192(-)
MTDFKFPWNIHPEGYKGPGSVKEEKDDINLPLLFTPLKIKSVELKNRIVVSPMCQYSSDDGFMNDWHMVALGTYAKGGAGLTFFEASAVSPEGRISPYDAGIWKDEHIEPMRKIVSFIHAHQGAAGLQIGHAGRKASTAPPFFHNQRSGLTPEHNGWENVLGPSDLPFNDHYIKPKTLSIEQIHRITNDFKEAAIRADKAGFDVLEIHGAHGYLLTSFLSPLSNKRTDQYGGSFENRTRIVVEVIEEVRKVWPQEKPLFLRLSCTEWVDGGWDISETVQLSKIVKEMGVDVIDCSSGGNDPRQKIDDKPLYQVPYAARVKKEADILTAAVGKITKPQEAEQVLKDGDADLILLAREFLREPFWPLKAAAVLGVEVNTTPQYLRAHDWKKGDVRL